MKIWEFLTVLLFFDYWKWVLRIAAGVGLTYVIVRFLVREKEKRAIETARIKALKEAERRIHLSAIETARIKKLEEEKQQRIATVKDGIADTQAYRLNILPFLTAIGSTDVREKEYELFFDRIQDFVLRQERVCRQLNADAEELKIAERTVMHLK